MNTCATQKARLSCGSRQPQTSGSPALLAVAYRLDQLYPSFLLALPGLPDQLDRRERLDGQLGCPSDAFLSPASSSAL